MAIAQQEGQFLCFKCQKLKPLSAKVEIPMEFTLCYGCLLAAGRPVREIKRQKKGYVDESVNEEIVSGWHG